MKRKKKKLNTRQKAARRTAAGGFNKASFKAIGGKECPRYAALTWKECSLSNATSIMAQANLPPPNYLATSGLIRFNNSLQYRIRSRHQHVNETLLATSRLPQTKVFVRAGPEVAHECILFSWRVVEWRFENERFASA